jgi:hypothetical protein
MHAQIDGLKKVTQKNKKKSYPMLQCIVQLLRHHAGTTCVLTPGAKRLPRRHCLMRVTEAEA